MILSELKISGSSVPKNKTEQRRGTVWVNEIPVEWESVYKYRSS